MQGVNQSHAETFLLGKFGSGVTDVAPLGRGEWSRAYSFRDGQQEYVARFGGYVEDFAKDRIAAGYASGDLPVPAMIEIGEAFGGYYAISERAYGEYIDEIDGAGMRTTLPSLFTVLDAMRQVDLSGTTGYGLWDAEGVGAFPTWREALLGVGLDRPEERTYGWREGLAASATGTALFDEGMVQLEALLTFCPEERHLIHSDLLHFNVLVADDRITAVVDWGCGLYGDFLYDVAWFAFWSDWFPAWQGIDFREEARRHFAAIGLVVPYLEERLHCYQLHIGLDSQKYNAFKGRWVEGETVARKTLAVARGA